MSNYNIKQNLEHQIIEVQRLLSMADGNPFIFVPLTERLNNLRNELRDIPADIKEPKVRLLFSGNAVFGSLGIKSSFVGKTMKPIQELIKAQTALIKFGNNVGKRGKVKKGAISEMYLTALPTGSFGYELSLLNTADLFDEDDVANSVHSVIGLIESVIESDERFESVIQEYPQRILPHLNDFFKEVNTEDSILKMESGSKYVEFTRDDIRVGYDRISSAIPTNETITIRGVFKGAFIESGRFEFVDSSYKTQHGLISGDLSEEQVTQYNREFSNEECNILLEKHIVTFNSGKINISYTLLSLN